MSQSLAYEIVELRVRDATEISGRALESLTLDLFEAMYQNRVFERENPEDENYLGMRERLKIIGAVANCMSQTYKGGRTYTAKSIADELQSRIIAGRAMLGQIRQQLVEEAEAIEKVAITVTKFKYK